MIEVADQIFLFEFKLDKSAAEALAQIQANSYYEKYRHKAKGLTLVGVNFDSKQRKVSEWQSRVADRAGSTAAPN